VVSAADKLDPLDAQTIIYREMETCNNNRLGQALSIAGSLRPLTFFMCQNLDGYSRYTFASEPGPASWQHAPDPRALPLPGTTWAKSANRIYSVLQSKWLLRDPSAICASEPEGKRWK
jgi:hypothetical protein